MPRGRIRGEGSVLSEGPQTLPDPPKATPNLFEQPHTGKFIGFTPALCKGEEEAGAGIDFLELLVLVTADLPQQFPLPTRILQTPNFSNEFSPFKINNCSV